MVTNFVRKPLDDAGRAEDEERCVDEVISLELRLGSDAALAIGLVSTAFTKPTVTAGSVESRRRLKIKLLTLHQVGQFSNAGKMLGGR